MALLAGGIALARTTRPPELELTYGSVGDAYSGVPALAIVLTFSVVGAIIASRHPRNTIGGIFCAIGLVVGFGTLAGGYAEFWLASGWGPRSLGETAAWFATWAWVVQTVALTFLLLLFPDGRLPSPRWRLVAWCAGLGISGFVVGSALEAAPLDNFPQVVNPYGVDSPVVRVVGIAGALLLVGSMVASAVSLIVRARHAGRVERQQIKWFAYATTVSISGVVLKNTVFPALGGTWVWWVGLVLTTIGLAGSPVAMGIAILRYRLYEIDLLINRTLVYGSLTVTLALVYFGSVVATQATFRALTGQEQQPQLAIVVSTLVIAALFNPLRRRIQGFIDRRFYRRKYDAAKTLAAFSVKLRDETHLDALRDDLVGVVRETMQPAHVSLWLRPNPAPKGGESSGEPHG